MARAALVAASLLPCAVVQGAGGDEKPVPGEHWRILESSEVRFRVRLFAMVPLNGRFPSVTGEIVLAREAATAHVAAKVDARRVSMRSASHSAWARSPEFFDAEHHPAIEFVSDEFPLQRLDQGGALPGKLTLRGTTKPVAFRIDGSDCDFAHPGRCRVQVHGEVSRSDFDMTARRGAVSDRVALHFSIMAERQ